jgi:NAD(P)-dependent dehydrogenase (short-subunit alcohol dehydrogenase family)
MGRLSERTVVVTGAAQGIGATLARALAAEGAFVAVADLLSPDKTVSTIHDDGGDAYGAVCDVTDPASVSRFVGEVLDRRGGIHGLVNNAAMFTTLTPQRFEEIPSAEFERVLSVNVRGTFEMVRAVAPVMRRQRDGAIVTVSSGELGADSVRVNCVAPGLTASEGVVEHADSFPEGVLSAQVASRCLPRQQEPDDLVGVMTFLLSPDSAFMTGQTLVVDGGSVFT